MATCFSNAKLRTRTEPVSKGFWAGPEDGREEEDRLRDSRSIFV